MRVVEKSIELDRRDSIWPTNGGKCYESSTLLRTVVVEPFSIFTPPPIITNILRENGQNYRNIFAWTEILKYFYFSCIIKLMERSGGKQFSAFSTAH